MGIAGFIRRRWVAHNARLLSGELAVMKDAQDPGGIAGGSQSAGPDAMFDVATGGPWAHAGTAADVATEVGGIAGSSTGAMGGRE